MVKTLPVKTLKAIGHRISPIVSIGQAGLTPSVIEELNRALFDHELIKIKLPACDKKARTILSQEACSQTGALLLQQVGRVALIYKMNPNPNPKLSNLYRFLA